MPACARKSLTSQGDTHVLRLADGAPSTPLLILHRAEPKYAISAAAPRSSRFVEDPGEGRVAALVALPYDPTAAECEATMLRAPGTASIVECDDMPIEQPGGGGGGVYVPPPPPTPGVYVKTYYSGRSDGWWGSLEIQFWAYGFEGETYGVNGNDYWWHNNECFRTSTGATFERNVHYENLNLLLSPNVTNVNSVNCNNFQSPWGYYVQVVEVDEGLNQSWDNFGSKHFSGFYIPNNGLIGRRELYYKYTRYQQPIDDALFMSEVTLIYR